MFLNKSIRQTNVLPKKILNVQMKFINSKIDFGFFF